MCQYISNKIRSQNMEKARNSKKKTGDEETKNMIQQTTKDSNKIIQDLGPYDILCGRGKAAFHNIGNRRFRVTMSMNLDAYMKARCKIERSVLIASIVSHLMDDVGARFLKPQKGGGYIALDEARAREKVGHALRDMSVAKRQTTVTAWSKQMEQEEESNGQQYHVLLQFCPQPLRAIRSAPAKMTGLEWGYQDSNLLQEQPNPHTTSSRKQNDDYVLQWQQNKLKDMMTGGQIENEEERVVPKCMIGFNRFSNAASTPFPTPMVERNAGGMNMEGGISYPKLELIRSFSGLPTLLQQNQTAANNKPSFPPALGNSNKNTSIPITQYPRRASTNELRETPLLGSWDDTYVNYKLYQ